MNCSEDVLVAAQTLLQLNSGEDGHLVEVGLKKEEARMKKKGARRSAGKNGLERKSAGRKGARRSAVNKNGSGICIGTDIARERIMAIEERAWKWNRETKAVNAEREMKSHNMQKPCCINLSPNTPDPLEKRLVLQPAIGFPRLRPITLFEEFSIPMSYIREFRG